MAKPHILSAVREFKNVMTWDTNYSWYFAAGAVVTCGASLKWFPGIYGLTGQSRGQSRFSLPPSSGSMGPVAYSKVSQRGTYGGDEFMSCTVVRKERYHIYRVAAQVLRKSLITIKSTDSAGK